MRLSDFVPRWLQPSRPTDAAGSTSPPTTTPQGAAATHAATPARTVVHADEAEVIAAVPWVTMQSDPSGAELLGRVRGDAALTERLARAAFAHEGYLPEWVTPRAATARAGNDSTIIDIELVSRLTGETVRRGAAALGVDDRVSVIHFDVGGRTPAMAMAAQRHHLWANPDHTKPTPAQVKGLLARTPDLTQRIVGIAGGGDIVDVEANRYHDFHVIVERDEKRIAVALNELGSVSPLTGQPG